LGKRRSDRGVLKGAETEPPYLNGLQHGEDFKSLQFRSSEQLKKDKGRRSSGQTYGLVTSTFLRLRGKAFGNEA